MTLMGDGVEDQCRAVCDLSVQAAVVSHLLPPLSGAGPMTETGESGPKSDARAAVEMFRCEPCIDRSPER